METLHREKLKGMDEADQISDYKKGFEDAERLLSDKYQAQVMDLNEQIIRRSMWISAARVQLQAIKAKQATGEDIQIHLDELISMHDYLEKVQEVGFW